MENTIISKLDLKVNEGEFTVIMGSSGSGKSTLLYLLSGLDHSTGGEIWFHDQPIHQKSEKELALLRRHSIGFVFQNANLVPNLTVWENILVAGYLNQGEKEGVRQRALSLLQQTGMEDLGQRLPSQLSGGQQQRCAIVRALINSPRILMADEPTGNLNSATSQTVLDIFDSFHQLGQTILMVTHDVKSACRGERILFFRDGDVADELRFDRQDESLERREKLLTNWLLENEW
ncbi:MAG: ABC transporter ATP-binding protein [Bacteroidales bacterium]|nr:ABC transporter ATP-binding protein [Bacteroidales bacterium]